MTVVFIVLCHFISTINGCISLNILFYLIVIAVFVKPPPPVGDGGGCMFSGHPSMPPSMRPSVRP